MDYRTKTTWMNLPHDLIREVCTYNDTIALEVRGGVVIGLRGRISKSDYRISSVQFVLLQKRLMLDGVRPYYAGFLSDLGVRLPPRIYRICVYPAVF